LYSSSFRKSPRQSQNDPAIELKRSHIHAGTVLVVAVMERDPERSPLFSSSPFDAEPLKVVSKVLPFELDALDPGARRSLPAPGDPLLDSDTRAFGHRFH
jgi:hypothetical protein